MDPLTVALKVGASGMTAQSERLRIVSENLANAQSTGSAPGADAYRRKTITFAAELDRASARTASRSRRSRRDRSDFPVEYKPGHEAADERATSRCPTSTFSIEMADMREAVRGYEANLHLDQAGARTHLHDHRPAARPVIMIINRLSALDGLGSILGGANAAWRGRLRRRNRRHGLSRDGDRAAANRRRQAS
jgi:flagellar basal-body rod protein FlgC